MKNKKIIAGIAGLLAGAGIIYGIMGYNGNEQKKEDRINWVTQTKERESGAVEVGSKIYYTTEKGIYEFDINNHEKKGKEILSSMIKNGDRNNIFYDNGKLIFFRYAKNKDGAYEDILCSYDLKKNENRDLCNVHGDVPYFLGLSNEKEKGMVVRVYGGYKVIPIDRKSDFKELKSYDANSREILKAERNYDITSGLEDMVKRQLGYTDLHILGKEKDKSLLIRKDFDIGIIDRKEWGGKR